MKNISLVLNIVLLILVGILFYLFFSSRNAQPSRTANDSTGNVANFTIAYFEMDSIEKQYEYVKYALEQLKAKETQISRELGTLENTYKKRLNELNQRGPYMTQSEGEAARQELAYMDQNYQNRKQTLEQEYFNQNEKLKSAIKKEIEDFLRDYNKNKGFSYIMANEPGLFYYRDTVYNITEDVVKGLNDKYKQQKK